CGIHPRPVHVPAETDSARGEKPRDRRQSRHDLARRGDRAHHRRRGADVGAGTLAGCLRRASRMLSSSAHARIARRGAPPARARTAREHAHDGVRCNAKHPDAKRRVRPELSRKLRLLSRAEAGEMSALPLPHIFTLTGNLLAERTLELDHWSTGKTHRAARETFQVGGKGINVAKMLNRLGVSNTALCFTGGSPGSECERWLRERGFAFRAFASQSPTRAGIVVRTTNGEVPETTFLGPDAPPDAGAIAACAEFLGAQPDDQVLAICGSFPGWS